jgi:hypothetical protein
MTLLPNRTFLVRSAALLLLAGAGLHQAAQAADVGVSVQISQPGVYGRVDIGRFPQPQVVVAQPVIVQRPVAVVRPEPVYMWVPPGHRKNWKRHCREYGACNVPVYFVQDRWYDQHVRHGHDRDRDHDHDRDRHDDRDHGKGKGRH